MAQRPRAKLELRGQGRAQAGVWARGARSAFTTLESRLRGATFRRMRTLAEIEEAIATLPVGQVEKLAAWLEQRRRQEPGWPVPPPKVERAELERIEAEFPTLRR